MHRYAALLRGITPSGRNMTNDKLRGVFERLGYDRVGSVLSSGNIVFASPDQDVPALEQRIEQALTHDLGLASRTIIRSLPELRAFLDRDPFEGRVHQRGTYLTVTFLQDAAPTVEIPVHMDDGTQLLDYDAQLRAVLAITDNSEPGKTPDFMGWLERTFGKGATTRTVLTVQRIAARLET